jgi:hypothetical protein
VAKVAFKLTKHLVNSRSAHLVAVDYLIKYLYETKHLAIRFDVSRSEDNDVFEATVDAAFANEEERNSAEEYTFKLFEDLID